MSHGRRGDIGGDIGPHVDGVPRGDVEVEHAPGTGSPAAVAMIVVADTSPSLKETAAAVLAVIVRGWLESADKAGGGEQDSAA